MNHHVANPFKSSVTRGWLLPLVNTLGVIWRQYLSFWGWSLFCTQPSKPDVHRKRAVMDATDTVLLLLAVGSYACLHFLLKSPQCSPVGSGHGSFLTILNLVATLAAVRSLDVLLNACNLTPFGADPISVRLRDHHTNRRVILLSLMRYTELIFWYAILAFATWLNGSTEFSAPFGERAAPNCNSLATALQTSMSTITTVGYGSFAPRDAAACLLLLAEALTAVVLLTVVISGAISLTLSDPAIEQKTQPNTTGHPATRATDNPLFPDAFPWFYPYENVAWARHLLPPLSTLLQLLCFFYLL